MTDVRSPAPARRRSDMDMLTQVLQPDDRLIDLLKICLARLLARHVDLRDQRLNAAVGR